VRAGNSGVRGRHRVVFDIGGNRDRLITRFIYEKSRVYIRRVLTHAEYDRGDWKK
jgi:mRNA interferase HigB